MKKNTQKILLALFNTRPFSPSSTRRDTKDDLQEKSDKVNDVIQPERKERLSGIKQKQLKIITPSLSEGGRRSLLYTLRQKGIINSERVLGVTWISITPYGLSLLEAQFPALSSHWDTWQDIWECMIFTKAPKLDNSFRYLRSLLVSSKAVAISRGVYLSPFSFSSRVIRECEDVYRDSVLVFSVAKWKIANLRRLIVEKYGLLDILESYSGVSKDIDRLLKQVDIEKGLTQSQKQEINLVYNRLRDILLEDLGFVSYYFPQTIGGRELLVRLNDLLVN